VGEQSVQKCTDKSIAGVVMAARHGPDVGRMVETVALPPYMLKFVDVWCRAAFAIY
jgi:hypothetical protein